MYTSSVWGGSGASFTTFDGWSSLTVLVNASVWANNCHCLLPAMVFLLLAVPSLEIKGELFVVCTQLLFVKIQEQ